MVHDVSEIIPAHLIDALGFGPPHDEREYDAIRRVLVALRSEDVHLVPAWASEHLNLLVECADLRAAYRAAVAESRSAREEAYKSQQERDEAYAEIERLKYDLTVPPNRTRITDHSDSRARE